MDWERGLRIFESDSSADTDICEEGVGTHDQVLEHRFPCSL